MSAYDNPRRLTLTFDFPRPGDRLLRSILRPVLEQLAASPDRLDTSLEGHGPHVFNRDYEDEVQLRVAHAFLDASVLAPNDRPQLVQRYDQRYDVFEAEGVRYAGELFRQLGGFPVNTLMRLAVRDDGALVLQAIPESVWRVPLEELDQVAYRADRADVADTEAALERISDTLKTTLGGVPHVQV